MPQLMDEKTENEAKRVLGKLPAWIDKKLIEQKAVIDSWPQ